MSARTTGSSRMRYQDTERRFLSLSRISQPPHGQWTAQSRPGSRLAKGTAHFRQAYHAAASYPWSCSIFICVYWRMAFCSPVIATPGSRWRQSPCLARRKARGRPTRALALDTRAMVNVDFSPALLLGTLLIAGGLALYQLRRLRPEISRDFDVIVSAVATFSGGILIFQVRPVVSQDIAQDICSLLMAHQSSSATDMTS